MGDDLVSPADIRDAVARRADALERRIVVSIGCDPGHSISDVLIGTGDGGGDDWSHALAASGAPFAANTGYDGYGDTAAVALTERLMALFALSDLDGQLGGASATSARSNLVTGPGSSPPTPASPPPPAPSANSGA